MVDIPIVRIPIKGGMTIPNIATFNHGTNSDCGYRYAIPWTHAYQHANAFLLELACASSGVFKWLLTTLRILLYQTHNATSQALSVFEVMWWDLSHVSFHFLSFDQVPVPPEFHKIQGTWKTEHDVQLMGLLAANGFKVPCCKVLRLLELGEMPWEHGEKVWDILLVVHTAKTCGLLWILSLMAWVFWYWGEIKGSTVIWDKVFNLSQSKLRPFFGYVSRVLGCPRNLVNGCKWVITYL